jgi:hypothetical protein
MAEPTFSMQADDDLPRTIRREREAKEAREREARERDARERLSMEATPVHSFQREAPYAFGPPSGAAIALDVPFSRLAGFFVKAVFAAIPALIVLMAFLWMLGYGLQLYFPDLIKLKILIYMPK